MPKSIEKTTRAAEAATITEIATHFGEVDFARSFINDGKSVDEFRTALLTHLASNEPIIDGNLQADGLDAQRSRSDAMTDALLARVDPNHQPAADAREFVGLSIG